jgi:4-amino-4-deoxychorismate lyase
MLDLPEFAEPGRVEINGTWKSQTKEDTRNMRLLETIRFHSGKLYNLVYHQERMNQSRKELFDSKDEINLGAEIIKLQTPRLELNVNNQKIDLFKLRVIYAESIEQIEIIPYSLPKIQTLKIVHNDSIDYSHKFLDRNQLDHLYQRKENCDDILIVKNGLITDTWFANILFYDGENWVTPSRPLLKGTQRQFLLDQKIIEAAELKADDLKLFKKARLINAMIRFEDELDIQIRNIFL